MIKHWLKGLGLIWIVLGAVVGFYIVWHVAFYAFVGFAILKLAEAGFIDCVGR